MGSALEKLPVHVWEPGSAREIGLALAEEYPVLRKYLGEILFSSIMRELVSSRRHDHSSARWYSEHLPTYLKSYKPLLLRPEIQEMAQLEAATYAADAAPNVQSLKASDIALLDAKTLVNLPLRIHPSAIRLTFRQNTTSLWSAMKCGEQPPKPHRLASPQNVVVWRQSNAPRFRILGDEEARVFDCIAKTACFAELCNISRDDDNSDPVENRVQAFLSAWVDAELVILPVSTDVFFKN